MGSITREERWAMRDTEAKQCCGSLTLWQRVALWSSVCLLFLWVGHLDVSLPESQAGPLLWSRHGRRSRSSSSSGGGDVRLSVAVYPSTTLSHESAYLRALLEEHGGGVVWAFRDYDVLEDVVSDLQPGDVVLYRGNVTLPPSITHSLAYHGHQGCMYCHAEGNLLLHDSVTRALLAQPTPVTLLLASDPSCKTHFPHNSPHRIIRTSYGRQTHACAVLPLPPPLPRAMTTTAMLKSSRRPLLIYYHDSLVEAADQIRSGLKLPSGAVAALPSMSVLGRSKAVLLPHTADSRDAIVLALDAGTLPLLVTSEEDVFHSHGCEDPLGWLHEAQAPILTGEATDLLNQLRGLAKNKASLDDRQAQLLSWWSTYRESVVGGILAFAAQANSPPAKVEEEEGRGRRRRRSKKKGRDATPTTTQPSSPPVVAATCRSVPLSASEERAAVAKYRQYYAKPSWFSDGGKGGCPGQCDVLLDSTLDAFSACFSPDCVPPPVADFVCTNGTMDHDHEEEEQWLKDAEKAEVDGGDKRSRHYDHRRLTTSSTSPATSNTARLPASVSTHSHSTGGSGGVADKTSALSTTSSSSSSSSSSSTRTIVTEVAVALLAAVWVNVMVLISLRLWRSSGKQAGMEGSDEERCALVGPRGPGRSSSSEKEPPTDDEDEEEEEEEEASAGQGGAAGAGHGSHKLVIVDEDGHGRNGGAATSGEESAAAGRAVSSWLELPAWVLVSWLVLCYYSSSIGIIYFNAYILDDLFPYPATLTMFHMLTGTLVSALLIYGLRVTKPCSGVSVVRYVGEIVPLAALYAVNLWASNAAYLYLDVGYIQMLKPVAGVAIYLLLLALGKEAKELLRALTLIVIIGGITIASVGTDEMSVFSWKGFSLVIGANLAYALYTVGSQIVMQDSGMSLDPISTLLLLGPAAALALAVVAGASEWTDPDFSFSLLPWWVLVLDCLVAVAVNLSVLAFLRYLNALMLLFAAYFKDILIVAIAVMAEHEGVDSTEVQGYALLLLGLATWRYMSYLKQMEKDAQHPQLQPPSSSNGSSSDQSGSRGHGSGGERRGRSRRREARRPPPQSV